MPEGGVALSVLPCDISMVEQSQEAYGYVKAVCYKSVRSGVYGTHAAQLTKAIGGPVHWFIALTITTVHHHCASSLGQCICRSICCIQ